MIQADLPERRRLLHPGLVAAGATLLMATLVSDYLYWDTLLFQYNNFSGWLLAGGLAVTLLAAIAFVIDLLLGRSEARMGPSPGMTEMFGEAGAGVGSAALIRLSLWGRRPGLMAFGAEDPAGFTPDMGAELVTFLARVVERTAARWPPTL